MADGPVQNTGIRQEGNQQDSAVTSRRAAEGGQGDQGDKRAKAHFKEHAAAVRTSATKIGQMVDKFLNPAKTDDQAQIGRSLKAEVAQLTLAVNNAHDVPDEDEEAEIENSGGRPVDDNAVDFRQKAS